MGRQDLKPKYLQKKILITGLLGLLSFNLKI
jgi:hypothetical protein